MELNHSRISFMVAVLESKYGPTDDLKCLRDQINFEFRTSVSIEMLHYWKASLIEAEDQALMCKHYY